MSRLWFGLAILGAALTVGATGIGTTLSTPTPRYPSTARLDGQVYGGPSIRFYQEADRTVAYDLDYGTGWRRGGNLGGATLQPGERLAAMYFDHYIYIFTTNDSTGQNYWKRADPDAGIDNWTTDWQPWSPQPK